MLSSKIIGVIPVRYASKRFPGKPLALFKGKPIIWWVFNRAKMVLPNVLIATDDERIKKVVSEFGGNVVMTSPLCTSGTDRIAEAISSIDVDIVINIQGDQPLIPPQMIEELISLFKDPSITIATLKKKEEKGKDDPNIVKVVVDKDDFALYFSRSPIPYFGEYYKHIGIYGYRKDLLMEFRNLPKGKLEIAEDLEQLRLLENGYKIKVKTTQYDSPSIDCEEDLIKIQNYGKRDWN